MVQPRDCWCCFYVVYTVLHKPVKHLDKGEDDEHSNKFNVELVSEYSHGQAGLHNSLTDPVIYPFHLRFSQSPQEDL